MVQNAGFRLKTDKPQGMKTYKKWMFTIFLAKIFARTVQKLQRLCKIKDRDLIY